MLINITPFPVSSFPAKEKGNSQENANTSRFPYLSAPIMDNSDGALLCGQVLLSQLISGQSVRSLCVLFVTIWVSPEFSDFLPYPKEA